MASTDNSETSSTKPYLIRAMHEWCCDNGLTPYVTVAVDNSVQVPREYVQEDEIVLNIAFDATTGLSIGNNYLEFKARFAGVVRDIIVPIEQVIAIFARENGQGMAFPRINRVALSVLESQDRSIVPQSEDSVPARPDAAPVRGSKPALKRIK